MTKKYTLGVIVGKFQTPYLTECHIGLLKYAEKKYDTLLVVIGSNQIRTEIDLYSKEARSGMIRDALGCETHVYFNYITDVFNKELWSKNLDEIISRYGVNYEITLCGGRDSFLDSYVGEYKNFDRFESELGEAVSATEVRKKIVSQGEVNHPLFRAGQLFEAFKQYPTAYQTIDAAIIDGRGNILLGRKKHETKFCLIGGFSEPTSESLEADVYKEIYEEANICSDLVKKIEYVGSILVSKDPRRAKSMHKNKTALFLVHIDKDTPFKPGDDIVECQWFKLDELDRDNFVERHIPVLELYMKKRGSLSKFIEKLKHFFL